MGVTLSNMKGRPRKNFLDLDMCWLLRHICGQNPHTEVQYMVYLLSAPHSYTVFDSATAVSRRKLQKTSLPGTLHGRYPQQVPYHWAQPLKLSAQQTNNQQDYTSVKSTGHVKAVDTINGVPTDESAIT